MKIAVASSDGVAVSCHFGRSACFIVYEIQDNKIANREMRPNHQTAFAQGQCLDGVPHSHDQAHSHADVVEILKDCQAILCQGMGWRAAEELSASGIQPLIVEEVPTCDDAVASYIRGDIKKAGSFCSCNE
ncbi:MAG: NifB/NifX family molybdenum-iron cluster-binding protein [Candidatus Sumerlaeota bacterium]|nr:NifB/NifX family molybdenum-iron cluster-binding protein [Candidatus Sumerlaeota bacterium]